MGPKAHPATGLSLPSLTPHNCNKVTRLALDHCQENRLEEVQALPGPFSRAPPLQVNTRATEAAFTRAGSYSPINPTSTYCKNLLFF